MSLQVHRQWGQKLCYTVEVLSGDENGWTKVRFHTLEGYMMTKYLVFGQEQFKVALPSSVCT